MGERAAILYRDWLGDAALSTDAAIASGYPLANLVDQQPKKVARFAGSAAAFQADFRMARTVAGLALAGTNLTATATIRVRLGDDGTTWAFDTGAQDAQADPELRGLAALLFTAQTHRHMRVDVADPALAWIDLGFAMAGPVYRPAVGFSFGWRSGAADLSTAEESESGEIWVAQRPVRRQLALDFRFATEAEVYADVRAMQRVAGQKRNVYVEPRPGHLYTAQDRILGLLRQRVAIEHAQAGTYAYGFDLVERL